MGRIQRPLTSAPANASTMQTYDITLDSDLRNDNHWIGFQCNEYPVHDHGPNIWLSAGYANGQLHHW